MSSGQAQQLAYRTLSGLLDRGVYPPGARLPGERVLAGETKVSRSTLRLALAQLAEEGRLTPAAQRGWFVPQPILGEPPEHAAVLHRTGAQPRPARHREGAGQPSPPGNLHRSRRPADRRGSPRGRTRPVTEHGRSADHGGDRSSSVPPGRVAGGGRPGGSLPVRIAVRAWHRGPPLDLHRAGDECR